MGDHQREKKTYYQRPLIESSVYLICGVRKNKPNDVQSRVEWLVPCTCWSCFWASRYGDHDHTTYDHLLILSLVRSYSSKPQHENGATGSWEKIVYKGYLPHHHSFIIPSSPSLPHNLPYLHYFHHLLDHTRYNVDSFIPHKLPPKVDLSFVHPALGVPLSETLKEADENLAGRNQRS